MSERDPKPFEFRVGQRELAVEMGKLVCVLFRSQQELDYFAVHIADEEADNTVLRVFNNVEVVRKLAGLTIHEDGHGITTDEGRTFYDDYGWWPSTIIRQRPSPEELEWYLDVNAGRIDDEWREGI